MKPLIQRSIPCSIPHTRSHFLRATNVLGIAVALMCAPSSTLAQEDEVDPVEERRQSVRTVIARQDVSGGGTFHYVIFRAPTEEEATGDGWTMERNVIARGQMGYEGISRVILAPETHYFMSALYADSLMFGSTNFTTPRAGETFEIPAMGFFDLVDPDSDGDGLSDIREFVVGTFENDPDSDDDEVNDAAEIQQGTDPLEGAVVQTGVIATAPVPGTAFDVIATNNIAIVAGRTEGISIFNIEASRSPTRIGQIDTPGDAYQVASFGTYAAVADSGSGLTIIDISDPPEARISHTVNLNQAIYAVTTYGTIAFAGGANGLIAAVDLISGVEISRYQGLSGRIWSLAVKGDYLYALRAGTLSVFHIEDGGLEFIRNVAASGGVGAGQRPLRIAIGDDLLYTTFTSGLNVFDISDPSNPTLATRHSTAQQGWKQIALNGNGQGLAAVSQNSTNDGPHHVSLYQLGADGLGLDFDTTYETLGLAASVTIYNGRGYVADSSQGLQVVNYLAFDRFGVAPEISIETNATENEEEGGRLEFEEGKLIDIFADVTDDVQVRNVQFYVNDEISGTDGNFPFGFRLQAPLLSSGADSFTIHAVATDTGGNMTTSETVEITLVPDRTPPRIKAITPQNAAYVGKINAITAVSSENLDPTTIDSNTFVVRRASTDEVLGTEDDIVLVGQLSFDDTTNRIHWDFLQDLPNDVYQVEILPPLADVAGNQIEAPFVSAFQVLGFTDSDGDGLPDFWELENGTDPFNPDSNNNGIPDGEEDADRDNLSAIGEFLLDRDPNDRDSNDDGTWDGNYDEDGDGLTDGQELLGGSDVFKIDTDGDGITDFDEINEGTNPLTPSSLPSSLVASSTSSFLNAIPQEASPFEELFTVASGPVSYLNALPIVPNEGVLFSVSSKLTSYLNALPLGIDADTLIAISKEVSYEAE
ncbi:Ig-like domain-containing protein [Pelagicoccus mobilis]|uniref:Ig-like domain-containing protein n=1 Tax=Pelagicoccus mobilis TaxID=415221 RepID=A0A934VQX5_9BACT|nr:Ig-like domain-containing protein [Pelagicoccus mobilis]MBK1877028.1 Ig-like domain-containing protein [Pelagicoccus mobilis]